MLHDQWYIPAELGLWWKWFMWIHESPWLGCFHWATGQTRASSTSRRPCPWTYCSWWVPVHLFHLRLDHFKEETGRELSCSASVLSEWVLWDAFPRLPILRLVYLERNDLPQQTPCHGCSLCWAYNLTNVNTAPQKLQAQPDFCCNFFRRTQICGDAEQVTQWLLLYVRFMYGCYIQNLTVYNFTSWTGRRWCSTWRRGSQSVSNHQKDSTTINHVLSIWLMRIRIILVFSPTPVIWPRVSKCCSFGLESGLTIMDHHSHDWPSFTCTITKHH